MSDTQPTLCDQSKFKPKLKPAGAGLVPLAVQELSQVVGGCSNPNGCTTLDEGLPVAALRRPGLPAFADPLRGLLPPLMVSR